MAPGEDLNVIDVDGDEQGDAITVAADGAVRASRSNSEPPTERLPDYVPDPQDEDEPEPAPAPAPEMDVSVKVRLGRWRVGVHGGGAGAGRPASDGNDDWSL